MKIKLRAYKKPLGKLVTSEMGKSIQEGWGEVQEMIDICDFLSLAGSGDHPHGTVIRGWGSFTLALL